MYVFWIRNAFYVYQGLLYHFSIDDDYFYQICVIN